ncbi:MAG: 1-acyl-sn-glycerol-3-phosphate acyltransferase [Bacteroidetes bacterium]|nr:MAG: 1-acyl-sn-glycerol-3-phosphate acyltransferase [Bacteroidota bacterium]
MIILSLLRALLVAISIPVFLILLNVKKLLFGHDLHFALWARQYFIRFLLVILGVEIDRRGTPPAGAFLWVSNHRSWLDPLIVLRDVRAMPVAKAEVSHWPLIGYGARLTGILYVKREEKKSRAAIVAAIGEWLGKGVSILIYPEGTTHSGFETLPFRRGAFRVAAAQGVGVVPIALEYTDPHDAWLGDETFVPHFMRTFRKWKTRVSIWYGPVLSSEDADELVDESRSWINDKLLILNNLSPERVAGNSI